ncbi:MAG TPA: chorismate pyruvate-lyase family protein [Methyloceanibacter sp.]|jgi:chorismate-pyruvate lyase|nr:chorismate pyruvate-lyase family protein [Methyloceanibacter sp.]
MTLAVPIEDFNIHSLGLVQRILVTTDGTLTDTLASIFLEPIELVKLEVSIAQSPQRIEALDLEGGSNLMHRQIVLRGKTSLSPYVYAEVQIATDRLPPRLRDDLLEGRVPLGALWIMHRLEIFKERPRVRQRLAGALARHLRLREDDTLIERTYRTFTNGRPVFVVSEYFPLEYAAKAQGA